MKKSTTVVILSVIVLIAIVVAIFRHGSTRSRIVGTWRVGPASVVFKSDGNFTSRQGTNQYAGTWRLSGKIMTATLTNVVSGQEGDKVGDTKQLKIVRVDAHQLAINEDGHTEILRRSK